MSVTNTDNRILASIVAHAIMPATMALLHPCQQGFLWGRNGAAHTANINHFFYQGVVQKLTRFLFLMDTAKAFDSIDHPWIQAVIAKASYPKWVRNFIYCAFHNVAVTPFFGSPSDIWIAITRGVKQGCPLSPLLFVIAYDPLLTALSRLPDISLFAFADDLAATTSSLPALYPALALIDNFAAVSGLGVNKSKSIILTTAPPPEHPHIKRLISTSPWPDLPLASEGTHLGIVIGREVTLERIFASPTTKALARIALYRPILAALPLDKKILLINTFIVSLFSYHFLFFVLPTDLYTPLKEAIRLSVTPFHGGAFSYSSLIFLTSPSGLSPPSKISTASTCRCSRLAPASFCPTPTTTTSPPSTYASTCSYATIGTPPLLTSGGAATTTTAPFFPSPSFLAQPSTRRSFVTSSSPKPLPILTLN